MKPKTYLNHLLIGLTAVLCSLCAEPQYYQNHEEPSLEAFPPPAEKKESPSRKSPKEIVAEYREELENRLADAWMHPTPHKIKAYQEMQQDMVERSKTFSEGWMKNVFLNPALDNTIANPVNQQARHVQLDLQKKR